MLSTKDFVLGVVLVIVCIALIVVADMIDKPAQLKKDIGKEICQNNSLSYVGVFATTLTQDELRCQTNQSVIGDHYNMTADPLIIHVKVDWNHYTEAGK